MSSPVEPVVSETLVDDLLGALDGEDAGAESDVEVPSPEAQPQPTETATPPDQQPETKESDPPAHDAGPAAVPETPPQPSAPPTGEPFTLRVDRNTVPIQGAVQMPDGEVRFSPDAWRKVSGNFIGDRREWQQKERHYQSTIQQTRSQRSEAEQVAAARNAEMAALMDKGPEAVAAWLDDFERNRPILEANIKARVLQQKLDAREQADQQRDSETRVAELRQSLDAHLERAFEVYSQRPEFAAFAKSPEFKAFRQFVDEDQFETLFYEGPGGETDIKFNQERFERLWQREAGRMQQVVKTTNTITQAAKRNAAATAPAKAPPKPAERPRKPNGQFTEEPFDRADFLAKTTFF